MMVEATVANPRFGGASQGKPKAALTSVKPENEVPI
jgi:hypothetical protein